MKSRKSLQGEQKYYLADLSFHRANAISFFSCVIGYQDKPCLPKRI